MRGVQPTALSAVIATANLRGVAWRRSRVDYMCDCTDGKHASVVIELPRGPGVHMLSRTEVVLVGDWEDVVPSLPVDRIP